MEINLHRLLSRCEARAADASDDHLVADAKFHTVSPLCTLSLRRTVCQRCTEVITCLFMLS